jgi:diaminohydroxyphosphoribosylaminopyrimidine deaminase/5-amino-6-(5-phosphoribosylamino)uracil reductase
MNTPDLPPSFPMTFDKHDEHYMKMALRLATLGAGSVSPNPMVGAVVVQDGEVVGQGWHNRYGEPHAEVVALRDAGDRSRGATLYVTLEPCNHHGKTPPCTEAILAAGIKRLVTAILDPNHMVGGGGAAFLREKGIQVETGLLAQESRYLNETWFTWLEIGLPFVIAKAACSLDGKIATRTGDSKWLTSETARGFGHRLRHECDAILVGIGTVLADNPQLTARRPRRSGNDPIRVVLDSHLRIPPDAHLLHLKSSAPTWVVCTAAAPAEKFQALKALDVDVLVMPEDKGRVALKPLLQELGCRQVQSLLLEGGAEVLGAFLDQRLVDKFYFFYAPKILGGKDAYPAVAGQGVASLSEAHQARDLTLRRLGPDLLVSGYLDNDPDNTG